MRPIDFTRPAGLHGVITDLLEAARRRRRTAPSTASSRRTAASCTRTATGCSARSTTPRTRCRTRCCAPGAASARFEGRSSLRSWLYRIATNSCLRLIERRPKRVLPIDYGPPADPHDALGAAAGRVGLDRALPRRALAVPDGLAGPEARYEQRESVELAFVAALQHLPPRQRAVLDPARRARLRAGGDRRRRSTPAGRRSTARCSARARPSTSGCPSAASRRRCARSATTRCARSSSATSDAWECGDVDAIVAMLTDDAVAGDAAPADLVPRPRRHPRTSSRRARCSSDRRWRLVPVQASGQLGVRLLRLGRDGRVVAAARDPGADARAGRPDRAR